MAITPSSNSEEFKLPIFTYAPTFFQTFRKRYPITTTTTIPEKHVAAPITTHTSVPIRDKRFWLSLLAVATRSYPIFAKQSATTVRPKKERLASFSEEVKAIKVPGIAIHRRLISTFSNTEDQRYWLRWADIITKSYPVFARESKDRPLPLVPVRIPEPCPTYYIWDFEITQVTWKGAAEVQLWLFLVEFLLFAGYFGHCLDKGL